MFKDFVKSIQGRIFSLTQGSVGMMLCLLTSRLQPRIAGAVDVLNTHLNADGHGLQLIFEFSGRMCSNCFARYHFAKVRSAFLPYEVPMDEFDCYNEVLSLTI